ncbi:hypothetical protein Ciccas_011050 [Cichlidogyrus casuarinus]|uniref:Uncharacterized protein n=1 Tax=Cichlidogyrus casuarinus TaxID=1844966 RepID=A0ABD2PX24_9PLAT
MSLSRQRTHVSIDVDERADAVNEMVLKQRNPTRYQHVPRSSSHSTALSQKLRPNDDIPTLRHLRSRSSALSSSMSSLNEPVVVKPKICKNTVRSNLLQNREMAASDTNLSAHPQRKQDGPTRFSPSNRHAASASSTNLSSHKPPLLKLGQSRLTTHKPLNHFNCMSETENRWLRELECGWISEPNATVASPVSIRKEEERAQHRLSSIAQLPQAFAALMTRSLVMAVHDTQVAFDAATPGSDLDTSAHLKQLCDLSYVMRAQLQIPLLLISSESLLNLQVCSLPNFRKSHHRDEILSAGWPQ